MRALFATTLALAAISVLSTGCGPAKPAGPAVISVRDAWSRPAAAGGTGVGFFELINSGGAADTLVAVESPIAETVQIHETSTEGGVMRMRMMTDGVTIKPGASVKFGPGGLHVMFIRLKTAQAAGDRAPATLVFKDGGRKPIELTVRAAGGMSGGDMEHHGH
jgi:copper(I)-binding protein